MKNAHYLFLMSFIFLLLPFSRTLAQKNANSTKEKDSLIIEIKKEIQYEHKEFLEKSLDSLNRIEEKLHTGLQNHYIQSNNFINKILCVLGVMSLFFLIIGLLIPIIGGFIARRRFNDMIKKAEREIDEVKKIENQVIIKIRNLEDAEKLFENNINAEINRINGESKSSIKNMKSEINVLIEQERAAAAKIEDNRIAFNQFHKDLIYFCSHLIYSVDVFEKDKEEFKQIYGPKLDKYIDILGLYHERLEKVNTHLQTISQWEEIAKDTFIHIEHLERRLDSNSFPECDENDINMAQELIKLIKAQYTVKTLGN